MTQRSAKRKMDYVMAVQPAELAMFAGSNYVIRRREQFRKGPAGPEMRRLERGDKGHASSPAR